MGIKILGFSVTPEFLDEQIQDNDSPAYSVSKILSIRLQIYFVGNQVIRKNSRYTSYI
jgi:hypothetical protein